MRDIRRLAHIHIPQQWQPEEIIREVKALGFTDLYFFANRLEAGMDIGGLSPELAMEVGKIAAREGMGVMINTGYMKYHEQVLLHHPDRRMVLRAEPAALDSDGGELNWLCPFNEANKDNYKRELRELALIPALRYLYLNDEGFLGAKGEMACYCDFCRKHFAKHFGKEPPEDIDWEDPLWRDWIKWRFDEWTALHAEFREAVQAVRPEVGVGMACAYIAELMGWKPWQHAVDLGAMSRALDSMNTGIYHGSSVHISGNYLPRFVSVLEVALIFTGALQGKPLRLAVQAFCPGTSLEMTRKDGHWIGILPYAAGVDYVTAWCYETLRELPSEYEGFMETFKLDPYFKETEPEVACSLFHSIQSEVWRYHDTDYDAVSVRPFAQMLRDSGLPYNYVWDSRLEETDLKRRGPLVLPHVCCLSKTQRKRLTSYLKGGGAVLATADLGLYDKEGTAIEVGLSAQWGVTLSGEVHKGQYRLAFTSDCPLAEPITDPVVVDNPYEITNTTGEVWATLIDGEGVDTGMPALVHNRVGQGRFIYLAGDPEPEHREPGYHFQIKLPNHTRRLIRNLVRFLGVRPPAIEVENFPPETAYQRLRPWDRRGINTFQFLPQVGPRYAMAIIASYLGEEGAFPIRFRIPKGKRPVRVFNGLTEKSYLDEARIDGDSVRLTVHTTQPDAVIPVVVAWA